MPVHEVVRISFSVWVVAAGISCSSGSGSVAADAGSGEGGDGAADVGPGSASDGGGDAGATGPSCQKYLSCLQIANPTAYGGAVQLYGQSSSACWTTPDQAAGCEKACETSFAGIGEACQCTGAQCVKCVLPPAAAYTLSAQTLFARSTAPRARIPRRSRSEPIGSAAFC